MNNKRKTKKIEVEVYEDQVADFILALNHLKNDSTNIYCSKVISESISVDTSDIDLYVEIFDSGVKEAYEKLKLMWLYFKKSAQRYSDYGLITGKSFKEFLRKPPISFMVFFIAFEYTLKRLSFHLDINKLPYFSAFWANKTVNTFIASYITISKQFTNVEGDTTITGKKLLTMMNSLETYYFIDEDGKNNIHNKEVRNSYFHSMNNLITIWLSPDHLRGSINKEDIIIALLLKSFEDSYPDLKQHKTTIYIGFFLSIIGYLYSELKYPIEDKRQTWLEYINTHVNNKLKKIKKQDLYHEFSFIADLINQKISGLSSKSGSQFQILLSERRKIQALLKECEDFHKAHPSESL
jgi:hypothetical protein